MIKDKIVISREKVERIQRICSRRRNGLIGVEHIIDDIQEFIRTDLKTRLIDPKLKHEVSEADYLKRQRRYNEFNTFVIKSTSLTYAFNGTGITRGKNPYLEELLELYLQEYDTTSSATLKSNSKGGYFSHTVIITLSQRAGGICSNPYCRTLTSGPSLIDPTGAYNLGKACLIYGYNPGDPRYDLSVSVKPDDIENGIWLCSLHAELINQNDGIDYPAGGLKEWKNAHEQLMHACLEGKKRLTFALNQNDDQSELVISILEFFNKQETLFESQHEQVAPRYIDTVKDISAYLLEVVADISYGTKLEGQVYAIDFTCDAFLQRTEHLNDEILFDYHWAAFKKVIGMILMEMAVKYEAELPLHVRALVPHNMK